MIRGDREVRGGRRRLAVSPGNEEEPGEDDQTDERTARGDERLRAHQGAAAALGAAGGVAVTAGKVVTGNGKSALSAAVILAASASGVIPK